MKVEVLKDIAIIYASVISTVSLIWNIYSETQKRKRKLNVELTTHIFIELEPLTPLVKIPIIRLTITNTGSIPIYIERPSFKLRFGKSKDLKSKYFQIIPDPALYGIKATLFEGQNFKYPLKIEPGERKVIDFDALSLLERLRENFEIRWKRLNGIRVIVQDTYGKKFSSNFISLKQVENLAEIVNKLNESKK